MSTGFPSPPALNKPREPRSGLSSRNTTDSMSDFSGSGGTGAGSGGEARQFVPSASPYANLSNLDIPDNPQEMFRICKFLAVWSPVHKAFVHNMASLPATDPNIKSKANRGRYYTRKSLGSQRFEAPKDALIERVRGLVDDKLRLKKFNQKAGINYWTYSSCVVKIHFPFVKMLLCSDCGKSCRADQCDWELESDGNFKSACKYCGATSKKMATDRYIRSPEDIRLSAPDMERIYTRPSGRGDDVEVYYRIPDEDVDRLTSQEEGDRNFILNTPQPYIEAALGLRRYGGWLDGKAYVKLRDDQYYLMRNDHIPFERHGLPIPSFLASLSDYWQLRQLQRASEAISNLQIYPLDMLYPESSSRSGNLFELINVSTFMNVIRDELKQHAGDPNYRPVVPFPVASHRVGGDGKNLLLSSEIRVYMEILCAALECPIEFLFGGLSYSGSDVSIQQMIAKMGNYRDDLLMMNRWVLRRICEVMEWDEVLIEFDDFRLGQDLPYIQMMASLKGQYTVGTRRLHRLLGIDDTDTERNDVREDVEFEMDLQRKRMKLDARTQQEIMLRQTMGQAEGQVKGQETLLEEASKLARRVRADPEMYYHVMSSPQLAAEIFGPNSPEVMQTQNTALASQVPQQPIPEVIAPQAAAEASAETSLAAVDPLAVKQMLGEFVPQVQPQASEPEGGYSLEMLVDSFSQLDPSDWGQALSIISEDLGPEVSSQIQAKLFEAQAYIGQRSPYARGQRSEMNDYGLPY